MNSHRDIMIAAGRAVAEAENVRSFCVSHFNRGLAVQVGAYPSGIPSEKDAPFLWLFAENTTNENVAADDVFTMCGVVGASVRGANGEKMVGEVLKVRTDEKNGLSVNGGNSLVEELRDMITSVIRSAGCGAPCTACRRTENDLSHFPLEWAEFAIDFTMFAAGDN